MGPPGCRRTHTVPAEPSAPYHGPRKRHGIRDAYGSATGDASYAGESSHRSLQYRLRTFYVTCVEPSKRGLKLLYPKTPAAPSHAARPRKPKGAWEASQGKNALTAPEAGRAMTKREAAPARAPKLKTHLRRTMKRSGRNPCTITRAHMGGRRAMSRTLLVTRPHCLRAIAAGDHALAARVAFASAYMYYARHR
jgi:hypothetical protein